MADRTMNVTSFVDLCAFLAYPRADVVKGVVEDYGYDKDTARELVDAAYREQDDLDLANAADEIVGGDNFRGDDVEHH